MDLPASQKKAYSESQLDKETEKQLKRGRAIRAVMGQMQYRLMSAETQIAVFMATNTGLLDNVSEDKILSAQEVIDITLHRHFETVVDAIVNKREKIDTKTQEKMLRAFKTALEQEGIIVEQ